MVDPKKQVRIDEVKTLLADFSKQHFVAAPDIAAKVHRTDILHEDRCSRRSYATGSNLRPRSRDGLTAGRLSPAI